MPIKRLGDFFGRFVGINGATGDATNPLAVTGPGVLFNGNTGGHQVRINKALVGDTASFLFQRGFSGRAEFGLIGNDAFELKVSADGSTFNQAFVVDQTTAVTDFKVAPTLNGLDLRGDISDNVFSLVDNLDATKKAVFQLSGLSTGVTRTFTLPNASSTLAVLAATQTFTGTTTFSGTFVVSAASATLGSGTTTATTGVGSGATASGQTQTVNLGTGGVSGSTTVVNIGAAAAGALGTTVFNTPSVEFAAKVTSINAPGADVTVNRLGVGGASPDATNRLSVNTPAVLLNNAGAGIDMKFNKNAAGNDAALTFQTSFTTHALMGLLANNDFTLKVGGSFTTAMIADNATGRVSFPAGIKQIQVGTTAPSSPSVGDLWVDTN